MERGGVIVADGGRVEFSGRRVFDYKMQIALHP